MKVIGIGEGTDILTKVPKPTVYLTDEGKRHFKKMAKILIKADRLKEMHLSALEIYGEAMAQFEYAQRAIKKLNAVQMGSGYVHTYPTGAKNITTEMVIRDRAIKILWECFKQFGLDPASESRLNPKDDPNQLKLFNDIAQKLKSS